METHISINLSAQTFQIEESAYNELKNYLTAIKDNLNDTKNVNEIIEDIEMRIVELFNEILKEGEVIKKEHVTRIEKTIGNPSDIGDSGENQYQHSEEAKNKKTGYATYKTRRMYRHPENNVLGGVCGGLGAFWNTEPLILRILFLIAFLGFGIGLLLYIILWIIIPKAKTPEELAELYGKKR
mgnify:CR=1 FL=1